MSVSLDKAIQNVDWMKTNMFIALSGILAEVQKPWAISVCHADFVIYEVFYTSEEVYNLHCFCQSAKTFIGFFNGN